MDLVYVISCQDYFMSQCNDIRYIVAALEGIPMPPTPKLCMKPCNCTILHTYAKHS